MADEKQIPNPEITSELTGQEVLREGFIDPRFRVHFEQGIPELSTEFATAYAAEDNTSKQPGVNAYNNVYCLVFDNRYPVPMRTIESMQRHEPKHMSAIIDVGKIETDKGERQAIILKKPKGRPLHEIITAQGPLPEEFIIERILTPIYETLRTLQSHHMVYGKLNTRTIFFDTTSSQLTLMESVSEFCGYSQKPGFETLERAICHAAGKGRLDIHADFFALGIVLLQALSGVEPFEKESNENIILKRLEMGSFEAAVESLSAAGARLKASTRVQQLLKGLLLDDDDRWGMEQFSNWMNRRPAALHMNAKSVKEAPAPFDFDQKLHYSRRHLAYSFFTHWMKAKTTVKLADVVRWVRLSVKDNVQAEILNDLAGGSNPNPSVATMVIQDEKLARVLSVLDSAGPIRYKDYAVHVDAFGTFIAYGYYKGNREIIQWVGTMINDRMAEYWVTLQDDPQTFDTTVLDWHPSREYVHARKTTIGFGIERCLYNMNPTLPCQSAMLEGRVVRTLPDLMVALDELGISRAKEVDPMDRHIAGFIAQRLDLQDDIRVKSIQRFPSLAGNPQIMSLALLTVAQGQSRIRVLKGITAWMNIRLGSYMEAFHSDTIQREVKTRLDKAAREGNLNSLFKIVADATLASQDNVGFTEARQHYHMMENEIRNLEKESNIEKLAYHYGLRFSVMITYMVLAITTLTVLFRMQ